MLLNVERASRLMDESGLDGLVATTLPNIYYLSGLWSSSLALFPLDAQVYAVAPRERLAEPVLVVPTGDLDTVPDCFPGVRAVNYGCFYREVAEGVDLSAGEARLRDLAIDREPRTDAIEALSAALEQAALGNKTIGLDERSVDPALASKLQRRFPSMSIRKASSIFKQIRMVKTKDEIDRLRAAVRVTEEAIRRTMLIAEEGTTELQMAKEFERALVDQGAELIFKLLRIGRHTAFGQARPTDTPLKKGDRIWLDVGCKYEGYSSDIMRTFAFGDVGERARRYYEAILKGQERGLQTAMPGVKAKEVYHATVEQVREAGIPHFRRHNVGHGMGIHLYDPPMLAPGDETVLEEGMVLNIEPPYYEIGTGALGVEDTFLVTKDGSELLTSISRKLEVLQ
ncbi:MAG TPA: Xaa-Pro peptidase family protein [Anaerolineae bacterium]|nr:Xaa-Pro peptidase family protein [Anaerolineae bacterium]